MRIVVCLKQIYDPATVKISRSREDFDLRQAAKRTNPLDRYALEAGLRLREAVGGEVIALTLGDSGAEDVVREAVAMGADHGVLVAGPEMAGTGGSGVAKGIAAALERLGPADLVLTGSGDPLTGSGSLAARLAVLLSWPVVLDALCVEQNGEGTLQAVVVDAGAAHCVPLLGPAVVAVMPASETPRYPHAARIANAYKPGVVDIWSPADLGLEGAALAADTEAGNLVLGPERTRGQVAGGSLGEAADTVLDILRTQRLV